MNLPTNIAYKPKLINHEIETWDELIKQPLSSREYFNKENNQFTFGYVAGRFLGVPLVEEEYFNKLYDLSVEDDIKIHILNEELDKSISQDKFQSIQEIIIINQKENGLSLNRLIAFMEGKGLIPQHTDKNLHRHVQYTLIDVLKHFESKHPSGLADPQFRRVFIDLIKWLWNHWEPWVINDVSTDDMPKVVWYGDVNKSQLYFLYFLIRMGCDVLIFHPEGKDLFSEIDPNQEFTFKYNYKKTTSLKPFPKEHMIARTTVAYNASKEIEHVLHHDTSQLYKAWQFRSFVPNSITLKTTYDELFILAKEQAFIRPNFSVSNNEVHIPSLFAKVAGISDNRKEYWDRLQDLAGDDLAITIREFPFTSTNKANYLYHYKHSLDRNGELDPQKMIESHYWNYGSLPEEIQFGLASVISRFCATPKIKQLKSETLEDLKVFLFKNATLIPNEFLKLLQQFDYSKKIPRVVLFNTEKNGTLSRTDAVLLLLLHEIGLDIILYSPTAQKDIEHYIDSNYFSIFMLENVEFDQDFQEKENSIIKKLLKNFPLRG